MTDRATIARQAASGLRDFAGKLEQFPVLIGFDGFVDSIISVVEKRYDTERFTPVETIEQFGHKVLAAAGQSANYELVVKREKLGGNGPIFANALSALGLPVTFIGSLGYPTLHPVFEEFAERASCLSIADPGLTDALEFSDGKLMFGKHQTLRDVNWQQICEIVGEDDFLRIVGQSRMLGIVNWTMLPFLNEIWQQLVDRILPAVSGDDADRRLVFIDLADSEKRTDEALREALDLCANLQRFADVILGLNFKEAVQVARVLGLEVGVAPESDVESLCGSIREHLALQTVVIHPRRGAAACSDEENGSVSAWFEGPFVREPKISTGAGDHFNAGFCLGRLAGLSLEETLCAGTGTSGYYVRHAASPTIEQLADFVEQLPAPEPT